VVSDLLGGQVQVLFGLLASDSRDPARSFKREVDRVHVARNMSPVISTIVI
jgi:hypothetical protein